MSIMQGDAYAGDLIDEQTLNRFNHRVGIDKSP